MPEEPQPSKPAAAVTDPAALPASPAPTTPLPAAAQHASPLVTTSLTGTGTGWSTGPYTGSGTGDGKSTRPYTGGGTGDGGIKAEKARQRKLAIIPLLLCVFLVGLPLYNNVIHDLIVGPKGGKPTPDEKVFPFDRTQNAAHSEYRGVVGAWTEDSPPAALTDKVYLNPSRPLVVRTFDIDGWVLDLLIRNRIRLPDEDADQQAALQAWAVNLRFAGQKKAAGKTKTENAHLPKTPATQAEEKAKEAASKAAKAAEDAAKDVQAKEAEVKKLESQAATAQNASPKNEVEVQKAAQDLNKATEEAKAATAAAAKAAEANQAAQQQAQDATAARDQEQKELQGLFNKLFTNVQKGLKLNLDSQLIDASPSNAGEAHVFYDRDKNEDRVDDFVFAPDTSKPDVHETFRKLALGSGFDRAITLTLSYKNGATELALPTLLSPRASFRSQQPSVSFVPAWKICWVVVYLGSILAILVFLAWKTSLLRSLDARRRPDGNYQLSLTHTQLALWFFVVLASYFYLWVITGDLENTFSQTGLYLVGISIVAALGSNAIQGMMAPDEEIAVYNQAMSAREGHTPEEVLAAINTSLEKTLADWKQVSDKQNAQPPPTGQTAADLASQASRLFETFEDLRRQQHYMLSPTPYRWLTDLLSENGQVTIHRFQMLAWTMGLAFIFCVKVFTDLKMPTFPNEVLALMGISAGTYLGFRIPEAQKIKDTLADPSKLVAPDGKKAGQPAATGQAADAGEGKDTDGK